MTKQSVLGTQSTGVQVRCVQAIKSVVQKRTGLALVSFGGGVSPAKLGWKVAVNLISFGEFAHTCGYGSLAPVLLKSPLKGSPTHMRCGGGRAGRPSLFLRLEIYS